MDFLIPFISLTLAGLVFAIGTNLLREHQHYHFNLKPNCLLTRHPVVFLTGPRSIFYFRKYWNSYPEILAEHGYEVFTLHLPWKGNSRAAKMKEFLQTQEALNKKYHFVCDQFTFNELQNLLKSSPSTRSLTPIQSNSSPPPASDFAFEQKPYIPFLSWAYLCHAWLLHSLKIPSAQDLGVQHPTAASWLLEKMHENGEQDFLG